MSFNKGDFTQQGVAGHVNAILRLNEKRLVNIDMTSNEEAEGCTISGTVTDLLNDKVYPIGSAPTGNIEITENTAEGEPLDISQYATATVNVAGGGGGYATLTATIINDTSVNMNQSGWPGKEDYGVSLISYPVTGNSTEIREFIYGLGATGYIVELYFENLQSGSATITYSNLENCSVNVDDGWLDITDPSANSSATLTLTLEG